MTTQGVYWHVHHDVLVEWCDDLETRQVVIRQTKPHTEHALRLRLLKPVRDISLFAAYVQARATYVQASDAYDQARAAYVQARATYVQAGDAYDQAYAAYVQAYAAYVQASDAYNQARDAYNQAYAALLTDPGILALHAIECPDCPWDGKTIFTERNP